MLLKFASSLIITTGITGAALGEDVPTATVKAAFANLANAPNHTFLLTSGPKSFVTKFTGKTERQGWTTCTQNSTNGTFDIVFKRRKGVIKTSAGWSTVADLMNPGAATQPQEGRPQRSQYDLLISGGLPESVCRRLIEQAGPFRKDGDVYLADLKPDETSEPRHPDAPEIKVEVNNIQVRLDGKFPARLEMLKRMTINGKTTDYNMVAEFTQIGTTKLEVPLEAKQRLEKSPLPISNAPATPGSLTKEEASMLAQAVGRRMEALNMMLMLYAMSNDMPLKAKSANEAFRNLFKVGLCEDESLFALPDSRARIFPPPDGIIGTIDDDFSKAVAPGECDLTLVAWPQGLWPPTRPLLRADVRASDGTVFVVVRTAGQGSRVHETPDGIVRVELNGKTVDMFSPDFGVEPSSILKPEPR